MLTTFGPNQATLDQMWPTLAQFVAQIDRALPPALGHCSTDAPTGMFQAFLRALHPYFVAKAPRLTDVCLELPPAREQPRRRASVKAHVLGAQVRRTGSSPPIAGEVLHTAGTRRERPWAPFAPPPPQVTRQAWPRRLGAFIAQWGKFGVARPGSRRGVVCHSGYGSLDALGAAERAHRNPPIRKRS